MIGSAHIVTPAQLRELCGKRRGRVPTAAVVRRWAKAQGIKTLEGADGPFTTDDALNRALGVGSANDPEYQADQIA